MAAAQEKTRKDSGDDSVEPILHTNRIDRTAPAGSENSLGAQSVRDGRPATDDSVLEAMDEEDPALSNPVETDKPR